MDKSDTPNTPNPQYQDATTFLTFMESQFEDIADMNYDNESELVCELAEDGWPDCSRWLCRWYRLVSLHEPLTSEERERIYWYWKAGEDFPEERYRLPRCDECQKGENLPVPENMTDT